MMPSLAAAAAGIVLAGVDRDGMASRYVLHLPDRVTVFAREPGGVQWYVESDERNPVGSMLMVPLVNDADKPEINQAHHRHLVHWALHRAFSKPDSETIDPTRAATAEAAFTRYFGPSPDADLRRSTRHDEVQTNISFMA